MTEELLAECGLPEPVSHLAQIIESFPDSQWCREYVKRTGLTDRTYRRHETLARQLVKAQRSVNDVRMSRRQCSRITRCAIRRNALP